MEREESEDDGRGQDGGGMALVLFDRYQGHHNSNTTRILL
jgi:hypothetical protein